MSVNLFGNPAYPDLTVEFGFSSALSGFGAWDVGTWDTALWGPDVVFVDVSDYVKSVQTNWQRSRQLDRQPSASLTVELKNYDGRFTPGHASGPYVVAGETQVRPRVPVRVTATWFGTDYPLFYGYVTSWQDEFPAMGLNAITTVTATDELTRLAAIDLATTAAVGAGETVKQRLERILEAAGWSGPTEFDDGVATVQATTLGGNALALCQLAAESDGGIFFAKPDGTLTFYDRNSRTSRYESVNDRASFGGSSTEPQLRNPVVVYDDEGLVNEARWSRVGGAEQVAVNDTSRALYGVHTSTRSDLICQSDADVLDIVQRLVSAASTPEYRIARITATCVTTPENWGIMLQVGLRDLIVASFSTPFTTFTQYGHCSGISHSINLDSGWWVTYGFESATRYLGSARWDEGEWDTDTWWA